MAAPRKYGDELRERTTRMAVDAPDDPATWSGAIPGSQSSAGFIQRR